MEPIVEQKKNFIIRFFEKIGGEAHKAVDYVADCAKDVFVAFLPLLKAEAGEFVRSYKDVAIKFAIEAAKMGGSSKNKIAYFGKEMLAHLKSQDITDVRDHLINLLREVVVAELKAKKVI